MMPTVVECRGLSKRYRIGEYRTGSDTLRDVMAGLARRRRAQKAPQEIWPLRDIDLDIAQGDAIGIVGRNGAGKSTLLKILSRITHPTEGLVRTRGRVGSLLEVGTGFHPELTGRENIQLNGAVLGMSRRDVRRHFDEIVDFSGVSAFIDTPVKRYSSGMYLRLAFSVAAHLRADIMLVDEVLAVGDAEFQRRCLGKMAEIEQDGRTVVFVSHNLDAVVRLCPRAIWLDGGRIRRSGPTEQVVSAYLGAGIDDGGVWTGEVGPAAGGVRLVRLAVLDTSGAPAAQVDRSEPFEVEITVVVAQKVPGLDLSVVVSTLRGTRVLDEAVSDFRPVALDAGVQRVKMTVPPVLGIGDYTVGVWIGTTYETFVWEQDLLQFRLDGVTNGRPDRILQLGPIWDVSRDEP